MENARKIVEKLKLQCSSCKINPGDMQCACGFKLCSNCLQCLPENQCKTCDKGFVSLISQDLRLFKFVDMMINFQFLNGAPQSICVSSEWKFEKLFQTLEQAFSIKKDVDFFFEINKHVFTREWALNNKNTELSHFPLEFYALNQMLKDHNPLIQINEVFKAGGGYDTFFFNSLENQIHQQFSESAPKWRNIDQGLNIEGKCLNKKCEVFDKRVIVKLGFGKFFLNEISVTSRCPICQEEVSEADLPILFKCKYRFQGRIQDEKENKFGEGVENNEDGYLTFKNDTSDQRQWKFLQFDIEKLD